MTPATPKPLTAEQLAQWQRLCDSATAGPWTGDPEPYAIYIYGADGSPVADTMVPGKYGDGDTTEPDYDGGARGGVDAVLRLRGVGASKHRPENSLENNYRFMIAAREALPALIAEVARLRELAKGLANGDCFDHADNCCADWCDRCETRRAFKDAAIAELFPERITPPRSGE